MSNEISNIADLFAQISDVPAPKKKVSTDTNEASIEEVTKALPELIMGLLDSKTGEPFAGADRFDNPTVIGSDGQPTNRGKFGPVGTTWIVRPFVRVTPELAQYLINHHGSANRDQTTSTLATYKERMENDQWSYVGNTCIFTIPNAGQVSPVGQEMHNGGHTCKTVIATGKEILMTFVFGIPKTERDKIDDNQARSAKDIVTTRPEIKAMFRQGSTIGGSVTITASMANTIQKNISEAFRIVEDIRHGLDAKTSGGRDKQEMGALLDLYSKVLANAVSQVIALNSRLEITTTDKKTGEQKKKIGGLLARAGSNHLSGIMTLAASYKRADGTLGWDDSVALKVLRCFAILGDERVSDTSDPMVSLRVAIDRWNKDGKHKGSTGMNIRFTALKTAVLMSLRGLKMTSQNLWDELTVASGRKLSLMGLGTNPESIADGNAVGIDDYVNPADAAMSAAKPVDGTTTTEPVKAVQED
jgi:hypothetical protein